MYDFFEILVKKVKIGGERFYKGSCRIR